ncbi:MAG: hypothetical protein K6B41_10175 [Butyrivibrio sp.]|nr:hypothetical protein [Butyrivibrio sp.]
MKRASGYIKAVIFIAILALCTWGVIYLLSIHSSKVKFYNFFHDDTEYEIFFLGASHMNNGVIPMQLWEDYGYTSYNLANGNNSLATSYWQLKMALEYHVPEMVILDVVFCDRDEIAWGYGTSHNSFDIFPMDDVKKEAINELFDDEDTRLGFTYPFLLYHNRWRDLSETDLINVFDIRSNPEFSQNGSDYEATVKKSVKEELISQDTGLDGYESVGMTYIRKIVDLCNENGIQIFLINIPYNAEERAQQASNEVYRIAAEMNVTYLNLQYEDDLVDYEVDFVDDGGHLNGGGAKKLTEYIGQYLQNNYSLTDYRQDEKTSELWDAKYEDYKNAISSYMEDPEDLNACLMLLSNPFYTAEIDVVNGKELSEVQQKLINQAASDVKINYVDKTDDNINVTVKVYDASTGELIVTHEYE